MSIEDSTPAEVVEIVGKTGMHGEAMQIKCRIKFCVELICIDAYTIFL